MRGIIHYSQKSLKTTSKKSRFEKKIQSSFLTPQKMARPVCTSWVFSYHIAIVQSSVYTLSNFWTFGPDFLSFYCITCFQKTHTFKDPRGFLSVIYHLFKERTFKGQRGFFLSHITCFQGTYTFEGPRGLRLIRRLVYNVLFVFGPVASQPVVSGKWRGWRHEIIVNTETKYEETEPKDLKQNKGRSNILK